MKTALALMAIVGLFSLAGPDPLIDEPEYERICNRGTLAYLIDGQACIYENSDGSRVVRYLTPHIGMASR